MKLPADLRNGMREMATDRKNQEIAEIFREKHGAQVAHLSEEQLLEQVREGRQTALDFGIRRRDLRMRFIMLHVLRVPGFWRNPEVAALLNGATGTADIRFGDVCALFKMAAKRQGAEQRIWW